MVAALLSHHTDSEPSTRQRRRLLICAPSNTAVDELLNRISAGVLDASGAIRKVRMVRLGEPQESASQAIQAITLDAQIEVRLKSEDSWVKLCTAKEQISRLDRELAGLPISKFSQAASTDSSIPAVSKEQQRARSLRSELATARQVKLWAEMAVERTRNQLRQQILLEADIVGATLSGSGRKQFLDLALQHDVTFDTAIIDEAAQATEPSCLIPLRLGCRRLVLVGDPRQLPATVLSNAAAHAGLGRSLFERLERADHEVVMLTVQYRMHPGE
jgi:senataxin